MDFLIEALDELGFWILGGGGITMVLIGWIVGKKMGFGSFPVWQLLIIMVGTLIAAAYFVTKD